MYGRYNGAPRGRPSPRGYGPNGHPRQTLPWQHFQDFGLPPPPNSWTSHGPPGKFPPNHNNNDYRHHGPRPIYPKPSQNGPDQSNGDQSEQKGQDHCGYSEMYGHFPPPPPPPGQRGGHQSPYMRGGWRGAGGDGHRGRGRGMKRPGEERSNEAPVKKQKKQKEKQEAKSCPYFCETCDRGYQMQTTYDEHISTHMKCDIEGCPYVAAEKLVKIHQDQQHRTGLAKKIWQLESKEDIEKWRLERRKKFPTKEKRQKHEELMAERRANGEFDDQSNGRRGRGRRRERGRKGRFNNRQDGNNSENQKTHTPHNNTRDNKAIVDEKPPTKNELQKNNNLTVDAKKRNVVTSDPLSFGVINTPSDSESEPTTKSSAVAPTPNVAPPTTIVDSPPGGALGSLMSMYGADSDSEEGELKSDGETNDAEVKDCVEIVKKASPKKSPEKNQTGANQTTENKESASITQTEDEKNNNRPKKQKKRRNNRRKNNKKNKGNSLNKTLDAEIKHEREVVLQCINYIMERNFFDGCNKEDPEDTEEETEEEEEEDSPAVEMFFGFPILKVDRKPLVQVIDVPIDNDEDTIFGKPKLDSGCGVDDDTSKVELNCDEKKSSELTTGSPRNDKKLGEIISEPSKQIVSDTQNQSNDEKQFEDAIMPETDSPRNDEKQFEIINEPLKQIVSETPIDIDSTGKTSDTTEITVK